ncbi:hypothetical protein COW99_05890 [Candidatus Roizmanbacteria bacterium CG22_combo_CG10-13_8_21_14_all_38_20]|uniref:Uncharacterized protein n=1 Tax=Candidatus Roizmanbacteria bacterium CG22_combo_CG10-13_8_21_14_all_38_20 TaxID=1974862 RepID=A0A2H0BTV8_9BACT|nr:MAG: hypothetical protein COW99_05890 [Candidatus Roizmanbacteria bacterium CG22_combo_CG10-13_8_21_14_all_38_20]PJC32227.1 MAG: hypothetical protein CO050_00610 [Candidatus Roizmanbacteria bacterium CG_4_9_14_0_2_um_filter_38_17]
MKILPTSKSDRKLFLISLGIAFILNIPQILKISSLGYLVGYLINTAIYAIVIMVIITIVMWVGKKVK